MNKPIDTSNVAGKIAVMQAFEQGHEVQFKKPWMAKYEDVAEPTWDWSASDYRLKLREPREFYVWIHPGSGTVFAKNRDDMDLSIHGWTQIKVREVLE